MNSLKYTEENGIVIISPDTGEFDQNLVLAKNKQKILTSLEDNGIVLLRGFNAKNSDHFQKIILENLDFEYWYPHKGSQFILNRVRKFIENITDKNDYRSYSGNHTIRLGDAETSVQGPHTESGTFRVRPKFLTMFCETTSEGAAETAIYNLHQAYELLTKIEKNKYNHLWNQYVIYTKPLSYTKKLITKLIFKNLGSIKSGKDNSISLYPHKTPLICKHPQKNLLCLQPWAFYNNTALAVHNAAKAVFPNRKNILEPDRVACAGKSEWKLVTKKDEEIEWNDQEKFTFFEKIFKTAKIHQWQQGDILILDNVLYGHGRLEDNGGKQRKLHQIQVNSIDMMKYAYDELKN